MSTVMCGRAVIISEQYTLIMGSVIKYPLKNLFKSRVEELQMNGRVKSFNYLTFYQIFKHN